MDQKLIILLPFFTLCVCLSSMAASLPTSTPAATTESVQANLTTSTSTSAPLDRMVNVGNHSTTPEPGSKLILNNSTKGNGTSEEDRVGNDRQYVSKGPGLSGPYNPFPYYIDPRIGGFTGPGVLASSCAYAYPNRRYSCYGLGKK